MQITAIHGVYAQCDHQGETCLIDMSLVGEQAVGTWILTFMNAAREVLTEQHAQQILDAIQALNQAMKNDHVDVDNLFADLVNREPELPPHLK